MEQSPRIAWLRRTVRGDRILDVGFVGEYEESTSHRLVAEANPDATVVGLDVKPTVGSRAADRAVRGDVFRLPFVDGAFDAVVFAEVLEHLEQPADALRELYRVLEPGGQLSITTPNPFGLYRYLRHYLFKPRLDPDFFLGADDHEAFLDPLSLSNLLESVGFTVTDLTFRNVTLPRVPTLPDWQLLRRFPFDRAGSYTCLVATKT